MRSRVCLPVGPTVSPNLLIFTPWIIETDSLKSHEEFFHSVSRAVRLQVSLPPLSVRQKAEFP